MNFLMMSIWFSFLLTWGKNSLVFINDYRVRVDFRVRSLYPVVTSDVVLEYDFDPTCGSLSKGTSDCL